MDVLIVIFALLLASVVVLLVSAPLRSAERGKAAASGGGEPAHGPAMGEQERRAELESAREAKYREIRDAELDYRTGKLSAGDYGAIDAQLRAEALAILDELEGPQTAEDDRSDGPPG